MKLLITKLAVPCVVFFALGSISCASSSPQDAAGVKPQIDLEHFNGDKVSLPGKHSNKIKQIRLDVTFPFKSKLLTEAKPYVRLISKDGNEIESFNLRSISQTFIFNKRISSDTAYIELALYFCKEDEEALCVMKNVLFDVALDEALPEEDLQLNYTVTVPNES